MYKKSFNEYSQHTPAKRFPSLPKALRHLVNLVSGRIGRGKVHWRNVHRLRDTSLTIKHGPSVKMKSEVSSETPLGIHLQLASLLWEREAEREGVPVVGQNKYFLTNWMSKASWTAT